MSNETVFALTSTAGLYLTFRNWVPAPGSIYDNDFVCWAGITGVSWRIDFGKAAGKRESREINGDLAYEIQCDIERCCGGPI